MTVLNQALQSSPIITLPTIVALGAKKQLFPNWGCLSSTGSIRAILFFVQSRVNLPSEAIPTETAV
jgi:hypothetical protein